MKLRKLGLLLLVGGTLSWALPTYARAPYSNILKHIDPVTPVEVRVKQAVLTHKCYACHVPGQERVERNSYGQRIHQAFGGASYTYDNEFWKRQDNGRHSAEAVRYLRRVINHVQ